MKKSLSGLLAGVMMMAVMAGCAPSVTVRQAGHARQFEITVSSDDFSFADTQDLLDEWHEQARSSCGGNYTVVNRDIVQRPEPFNEIFVTGIVECN